MKLAVAGLLTPYLLQICNSTFILCTISIYITNISSCNVTINCIVDYPVHCVSDMYIVYSVYIPTGWRDTIISGSQGERGQHC